MSETYTNERVLVTGGLGFIGRNVVEGLLQQGEKEITVIDDCSNSSPELPPQWDGKVEHLQTSVTGDEWFDVIAGSKTVIHLACKTILECDAVPTNDLEVNALSTLRILEHIRQLRDKPNLVYTSSACVYGVTPDKPISEDHPVSPSTPYGISKLAGEQYVASYGKRHSLSTVALRLSNVYGPGQTPSNPYCGVIGIFLRQASKGQPLSIIGDGTQSRDFTFVGDAVQAILTATQRKDLHGEIFNVSHGKAISINELAKEILCAYPDTPVANIPPRSIDDIHHRVLNSTKARKQLMWAGVTTLHEGLTATINSNRF